MAQAKSGDQVKIHYTGTLADGTVFDSSQDREPLEFTLGSNQVIPGFEQAVAGMTPGETKTVDIPAAEAYGPRRDDMVIQVAPDNFPDHIDPSVGDQLQLRQPDGSAVNVVVRDVNETAVTLDANHPLAGKDLTFELNLVAIGE